jgi:two-component system, NtrC family, sensor histidine kinase HydH
MTEPPQNSFDSRSRPRLGGFALQMGLVAALFLASIAALVFNVFSARVTPQRESEISAELREASRRMAELAAGETNGSYDKRDRALGAITQQALAHLPGAEGGFYLGPPIDRFAGYGSAETGPAHPPRGPHGHERHDPPPHEMPYVQIQVAESLTSAPGESTSTVLNVRLSRVVIVTEPVGDARPATMATWLLYRLVKPEERVRRYQLSTGLAIGGLVLALIITGNLGRGLRRQRDREERLRDELRRSERLAALGKLLAGVAHEVRNPLAGIRSTVQLWQRMPERAMTPHSLEAVIQAVDRLNQTVSQLLYFSRADAVEQAPVDLNGLIDETLDLLAAQAESQAVTCERRLDRAAPSAEGSASALRQVLMNLATNALQAMPDGGRLVVTTRVDTSRRLLVCEFTDSGSGVSPADQAHLFEPFFTTRPTGTGLGLALCREIIVQHGGRIEYHDAARGGASFLIELPLGAAASSG